MPAQPPVLRSNAARLLFSLTGLASLGGFLLLQVALAARAVQSDAAFAEAVDAIERMPLLRFVQVVVYAGPLAIHAAMGTWLLFTRTSLRSVDAHARRPAPSPRPGYPPAFHAAVRATGAVALAFLALCLFDGGLVAPLRHLGGNEAASELAAGLSSTWLGVPWRAAAYLAGTACVAFHFSAGAWGFITGHGVLESRVLRSLTAGIAVALGVGVWAVLANFVVFEATGARLLGEAPATGAANNGGWSEPCPAPPANSSQR
jgi:succinate dehydrogenase/fumarate reductase cytochrome b subunit